MKWWFKTFNELTIDELYKILKLRAEVFILEQKCNYLDLDEKDRVSYHLYLEDNGKIIAYLRIIPKGISYNEVSIGRVLVKKEFRKKGISREMLEKAISYIENELKETKIRISAQSYLVDFYKSLGFKSVSDIYLEAGLEHVEMLK